MNFWVIMVAMAGAFLLQIAFGSYQVKDFSKAYARLRARGRVAIGRCAGRIKAGAIVMFAIDENGNVLDAVKLQGVTALARFRYFPGFEGKHIESLPAYAPKKDKQTAKAIADAVKTYVTIQNGGAVAQPLSPFQKIESATKSLLKN